MFSDAKELTRDNGICEYLRYKEFVFETLPARIEE
jgi:hypothetical protein